MNCKSFESVIHEVAADRMMEAAIREEALLHSTNCDSCAVRLNAERALTKDLRELRVGMQSLRAPDRIQEHLLEQLRAEKYSSNQKVSSSWHRFGKYAAIAAMLLLVIGVVALRLRTQSPSRAKTNTPMLPAPSGITNDTLVASSKLNSNEVDPGLDSTTKPHAGISRTTSKRLRTTRVSPTSRKSATPISHSNEEVATDFLPIGYTSLVNVQDGGQIVRVELPRSAMARFGLPVNMDRYDESVKADVLVSADGLARAIRFVQ